MGHSEALLRSEVSHYLILGEQLKAFWGEIDEETFRDTLEGITELPELIGAVVRSSLDEDAIITGLKGRLSDMQARVDRIRARFERKRELAKWAMESAGLEKIQSPDFSVSMRHGPARVEVMDESMVPPVFLVPQPPKLDRVKLTQAVKAGEVVEGAMLMPGNLHITVRTR